MIRSYIIVAFRNLLQNKLFSLINVLGLGVGIAASFMLYQYTSFESSYDNFHNDVERIYRVNLITNKEGEEIARDARTAPAIGSTLLEDFTEVVSFSRTVIFGEAILSHEGNNVVEKNTLLVDPAHFELLDYEVLKGVPEVDLKSPLTVFLSSDLAEKLYGDADPVNKTLSINNSNLDGSQDFIVKGVFKNQRVNAHLRPELLVSYATLHHFIGKQIDTTWDWNNLFTYIKVAEGTNMSGLKQKVKGVVAINNLNDLNKSGWQLDLQPITAIHTDKSYTGEYVQQGIDGSLLKYYTIIGAFILLIAYINFINLYTSKATERAKEIGVRKVSGASFSQLVVQLLTEVFVINLLGVLLALTFIQLLYPFLTNILEIEDTMPELQSLNLWMNLVVLLVIGTFLSGLYPAFVMASWLPSKALKGARKMSIGGIQFRKSLVVFQFTIASFLICGTLTVLFQIDMMKNYDLGFVMDQKIIVKSPQLVEGSGGTRSSIFKKELKNLTGVRRVAALNEIPGTQIYWKTDIAAERLSTADHLNFTWLGVDHEYFDLFEVGIIAGRSFQQTNDGFRTSAILNRKAARLYGFDKPQDAIGSRITLNDNQLEIVGVSENFNQESLKKNIEPIVFRYSNFDLNYFAIHIDANNLQETVSQIGSTFIELFPDSPFEYFFLDEHFNKQYNGEVLFAQIFTGASLLALFISCLGMLGLSYQTIAQKTKEIGIRKVLGASLNSLLIYLTKDYVKLVVIACFLGISLAYFTFSNWLTDFITKIDLGLWFFFTPLLVLGIAIVSVITLQTLKVALKNPVDSLKYE